MKIFHKIVFVWLLAVCFLSDLQGVSIYTKDKNLLTEEEKRGASISNEINFGEESSPKAETKKRGIWATGSNNRHYGGSYSGGYEPSGYGDSGGYYPPGPDGTGYGHTGHGYHDGGSFHHSGGGYGLYGGRPGGYETSYDGGYEEEHHYHTNGGGGHDVGSFKGLALKKLLLPLAGLAILGVAAVAAHNPVLLQLGVVNGRRKRSLIPSDIYPRNPRVQPSRRKD